MKKVFLLLHGFKRNDVNDFDKVVSFFEETNPYKIYNEVWYENYNKETLNNKYTVKRINEIAKVINNDEPTEVVIVGYSSGTLVGLKIKEKLNCENIKFIGVVAPRKIYFWRWVSMGYELLKTSSRVKKRLGKERYNRLKKMQQDAKQIEKYPISIMRFIHKKIVDKYGKELKKIDNGYFLFTENDHIMNTNKSIKALQGRNNKIDVKEFNHETILASESEIFLDWIKDKI